MLQAIIDDPSPGPSIVAEPPVEQSSGSELKPEQSETKLRKILRDRYDSKNRGWGTVQKFLDWDIVEYCMGEAMRGDREFGAHGPRDARRPAPIDRSGLGRRLSIFDRR